MKGLTILFIHLLKNDLSLQIRKNIWNFRTLFKMTMAFPSNFVSSRETMIELEITFLANLTSICWLFLFENTS